MTIIVHGGASMESEDNRKPLTVGWHYTKNFGWARILARRSVEKAHVMDFYLWWDGQSPKPPKATEG